MAAERKLFPDMYIGKKFGKLYITGPEVRKPKKNGYYERFVYGECDCGKKNVLIRLSSLMQGDARSCGCEKEEAKRKFSEGRTNGTLKTIPPTIHGDSVTTSPYYHLFHIWIGMRRRCNNPNDKSYPDYGGKGIKVCPEWEHEYLNFKKWALENGYITGLSIDRIDNTKGYSPDNCRWASDFMQANNKSNNTYVSVDGETHTKSEWCKYYNLSVKSNVYTDTNDIQFGEIIKSYKENNVPHKPFIIVNQAQFDKGSKELEERRK